MQFSNVTAVAKANVYFEGKVVSHTILLADGSKKTLGLIYAGSYHFGTDAAERMEITDGECENRSASLGVRAASRRIRRAGRRVVGRSENPRAGSGFSRPVYVDRPSRFRVPRPVVRADSAIMFVRNSTRAFEVVPRGLSVSGSGSIRVG